MKYLAIVLIAALWAIPITGCISQALKERDKELTQLRADLNTMRAEQDTERLALQREIMALRASGGDPARIAALEGQLARVQGQLTATRTQITQVDKEQTDLETTKSEERKRKFKGWMDTLMGVATAVAGTGLLGSVASARIGDISAKS